MKHRCTGKHCAPPNGTFGQALLVLLLVASALAAALAVSRPWADTLDGFEIDADHPASGEALYSQTADDWAETGGSAGEGVFLPGTAGAPDFLDCFGSDISVNPSINGQATLICDGSSDASFDGAGPDVVIEPERNVVGPGGKQTSDVWPIMAGSVTAKDDFSHAYNLFRLADSPCDADTLADDPFLVLAGHRGDNEGDAFWGFELNQTAPTGFSDLAGNTGASFDLDFNRNLGDLLVSITLVGGGSSPLLEVFAWEGTTFVAAPSSCPANPALPQGDSLLRTNPTNDVQAPPWNVPACDPTATNGANSCRVVNASGVAPAPAGDNLIPPRDFIEAILDLSAFISSDVCYDALIFTSRAAHPLASADLKDVGGVNIDTCVDLTPPSGQTPSPTPTPPGPVLPPLGGAPPGGPAGSWLAVALGALLVGAGGLALAGTTRRSAGRNLLAVDASSKSSK